MEKHNCDFLSSGNIANFVESFLISYMKNLTILDGRLKLSVPVISAVVAGLIAVIALVMYISLFSPGSPVSATLRIPADATYEQVRDSLEKKFGGKYAGRVLRISSWLGFDARARHGAYYIDKGASPFAAARRISRGAQSPVRVTINGFRNRDDMVRAIAGKFEFTADQLSAALSNPELLDSFGLDEESATCLFLNDSYDYFWTDSPDDVVKKIAANYKAYWTPERLKKAQALGLTPKDAVIIASIVDEETTVEDEKGTIARLYINRLQKGMRLQADPTVRYAIGDFSIKRVGGNMLNTDSPYNTYRHNGLPPGPIRTVGTSTLDALLDSKPSPYLYMCARPDFSGRHDFSQDFSTHRQNAANYHEELDRRNIRH